MNTDRPYYFEFSQEHWEKIQNQKEKNMNTLDAFPSKYLRAEDISGMGEIYTVKEVGVVSFPSEDGETEKKLVVYFNETQKMLSCNVTNRKILVKRLGVETDDWIGKEVTLYLDAVTYKGRVFDAIRVK